MIEIMSIRLDEIKKILAAFYYEKARFEALCPELEDIMSRIDLRNNIEQIFEENAFISDNFEEAKEINDFPTKSFEKSKTNKGSESLLLRP